MSDSIDVVVKGVRSPVMRAGSPSREAVVFVHGNPGGNEDFRALVEKAGAFAYAIAPDMPGFGKADRPDRFDYTVDGYARHLDGVLSELGIERVHLVLHDFGGPWGLAWASTHLDRVASVTLINIGILEGYTWHTFARIWRTPILGELLQLTTTRAGARAMLNASNPKPFPDAFIDRIYDDADWGHKRAVLRLYRSVDDLGAFSTKVARAIAPRSLPALVVWGAADGYLPVRYAEEQKKYFDASVHVLEHSGHWPMIDEPERVDALVVPFLRERVRGSASTSEQAR